jgi:hypothetical protein
MSAELTIYNDPAREVRVERIELREIVAPEEFNDLLYGEPVPVYGRNTGDTHIRELQAHLAGEGTEMVQLAPDDEGLPGVWAAVGMPIWVAQKTVYKGDNFRFWARGVFSPEDAETDLYFKVVFKGLSTGVRIASQN